MKQIQNKIFVFEHNYNCHSEFKNTTKQYFVKTPLFIFTIYAFWITIIWMIFIIKALETQGLFTP